MSKEEIREQMEVVQEECWELSKMLEESDVNRRIYHIQDVRLNDAIEKMKRLVFEGGR